MSIKTLNALLLAGVLSLAAASAAQAGGKVVGSDFRGHANVAPAGGTARSGQIPTLWRPVLAGGGKVGSDFHASAAPACGDQCPVLAGEGPVGAGDNNGRSGARVAGDGGPVNAGEGNGRSSAALSQGGAEFLVASIRAGQGDF
jgi:hypothetical protein